MSEPNNIMDPKEVLGFKLEELRRRHRSLDDAITSLEASPVGRDSLDLRRLKKQKLGLKDEIARIEDQLTPDIIA
ncbi:MAG: YdcH family protein [Pseudomonadota bacterium]